MRSHRGGFQNGPVISGLEEVSIQFKCLTSDLVLTMGEGTAGKCSRIPGKTQTYELCNASHS